MAWDFFPLDIDNLPERGFQNVGIYQELLDAIEEKRLARGQVPFGNPFPVDSTGWNIQYQPAWAAITVELRSQVESDYWAFNLHPGGSWEGEDAGVPSEPDIWQFGVSSSNRIDLLLPQYANVGQSVGGNSFTAIHGPPNNLQFHSNLEGDGDNIAFWYSVDGGPKILAPHLNEFYRVLDSLRWTVRRFGSTDEVSLTNRAEIFETTTPNTHTDPQDAIDALEAKYPGTFSSLPDLTTAPSDVAAFRRYMRVTKSGIYYNASGYNDRATLRVEGINTDMSHSADAYVFGGVQDGVGNNEMHEFDDDGLGFQSPPLFVGDDERLDLIQSFPESKAAFRETALFGDDATVQDAPTPPTTDGGRRRGWSLVVGNGQLGFILKWDGPNGMKKLTGTGA